MKNTIKRIVRLLGFIAFAVIIAFSFATCKEDSGGDDQLPLALLLMQPQTSKPQTFIGEYGLAYTQINNNTEFEVSKGETTEVDVIIPPVFNGKLVTKIAASVLDLNSFSFIGGFAGYTTMTSVTIPDSVKSFGDYAFAMCTGLTSVTIPNSVTSIGERAFVMCTGLTSVTIPDSVTSIGDMAFAICTGLTSINVNANNPNYSSQNGILYNKAKTTVIQALPAVISGSITIPNTVTSIGYTAFAGCSGLTSIIIPNSVTSISNEAFSNCTGLTSVTIPDSVTSIGDYAFAMCTGLTSITIPNSVTSIGSSAFNGCRGLTSVTIPDSVTSISDGAFNGCTGLTNVTIPNSVTSIGSSAFNGCSSLTSITIPDSVTSIGGGAFVMCTGLTSVTIPNSVTSIGFGAFFYCTGLTNINVDTNNPNYLSDNGILYNKAKTTLIQAPAGISGSITIPNTVTSIGVMAFRGCTGLTSVTIPNSVIGIGSGAFAGCNGLTSVTFQGTINADNFDNYAFDGDLRAKYLAGSTGTYTRSPGSDIWTKQ